MVSGNEVISLKINCDYTNCQHNYASNKRTKRFGARCSLHKCILKNSNSDWILHNSVGDCNYNVKRLTDDELRYCLYKEKRKTSLSKLQAEARRRGLIEKKR